MKFSDAFTSDKKQVEKIKDLDDLPVESNSILKEALFLFPYPLVPPQTPDELKPIQEMVDKRVSKWLNANPSVKPISSIPKVSLAKPGAKCGYLEVSVLYTDEKSITERNVKDQTNEKE